jgi:hypothetical protein
MGALRGQGSSIQGVLCKVFLAVQGGGLSAKLSYTVGSSTKPSVDALAPKS